MHILNKSNEFIRLGSSNVPPKSYELTKTAVPGMENLPSKYWLGESKRLPKQCRVLLLPLVAFQNLKVKPLLLKTLYILHALGRKVELELTLNPSHWGLANIQRCYTSCQGRRAITSLTQLWKLQTQSSPAWQGGPEGQQWQSHLESNQQWFTRLKEFMSKCREQLRKRCPSTVDKTTPTIKA